MNMNTNVLTKEPEILTDKKGNSFRLIPEEEYNYMLNAISFYDEEDLTEEDFRKIAISKEQSKLGLTSKSEDVFKRIQEKRSKQWKYLGLQNRNFNRGVSHTSDYGSYGNYEF